MNDEQDRTKDTSGATDDPRRARARLWRWNLQTMLLLMAVAAAWTSYFASRHQNHRLQQQVDAMRRVARELIINDPQQIAVVKLDETWKDEFRWKVYLPADEYSLRLATRKIDTLGFAPVVSEANIGEGIHEIELLQSEQGDGWTITVKVDGKTMIEALESQDWNPRRNSVGAGNFASSTQLSPADPVILFRTKRDTIGSCKAPCASTLKVQPRACYCGLNRQSRNPPQPIRPSTIGFVKGEKNETASLPTPNAAGRGGHFGRWSRMVR